MLAADAFAICSGAEALMSNNQSVLCRTIEALAQAAYPSFEDGPLDAAGVARGAGTDPAKTAQLLHALVAIGLMRFDGSRFSNSPKANSDLVGGKTDYNLLFVNDCESALIHTEVEHRLWLSETGFSDISRDRELGTYAADYMVTWKALPGGGRSGTAISYGLHYRRPG